MTTTYEIHYADNVSAEDRQRVDDAVKKTIDGINNGQVNGDRTPGHIVFTAYDIVEEDDPLVRSENVGGYAMREGMNYSAQDGSVYTPATDEVRIDIDGQRTDVELEEVVVHEVTHLTHEDPGGDPGGVHSQEFYNAVSETGDAVGISTPHADEKVGRTVDDPDRDGGKRGRGVSAIETEDSESNSDDSSRDGGKGSTSSNDEDDNASNDDDEESSGAKDSGKPIVVDLDGDGIELVNLEDSTATFDFDDDGYQEKTAWVGSDDGLLVFDVGSDGKVTEAKEIAFAYWTEDEHDTDLEGLRTVFDSNQDGHLNSLDEDWNGFRIWVDENQNGITDEGELLTLDEAQITSLNLSHRDGSAEVIEDGTINHGLIDVERTNGDIVDGGDIAFAYESLGTREITDGDGNTLLEFEGDTFEFVEEAEGFTVADYEPLMERISSMGFTGDAHSSMQFAVQNGDDVVFIFDSESVLTVENVTISQLEDAFIF